MNPVSRFKPLDHLPLSPGVCFICKGGVGPFIDTSLQVDFEGAIYICKGCIVEMFAQLGLNSVLNAEEVEQLTAEAFASGFSDGELSMMGKLSEFINSRPDRRDSADANDADVPDDNPVETLSGAPESDPEPAPNSEQGYGFAGLEELGGLSGDSGDGKSLFSLG